MIRRNTTRGARTAVLMCALSALAPSSALAQYAAHHHPLQHLAAPDAVG